MIIFFKDGEAMRMEFDKGHRNHGAITFAKDGKAVRREYAQSHPKHGMFVFFENDKIARMEFATGHSNHSTVQFVEDGKVVGVELAEGHMRRANKVVSRAECHSERAVPMSSGAAILNLQRLIRKQIKVNRENRTQTALNIREARRREVIRERCRLVKMGKQDCALTPPGPSGPRKSIAWIAKEYEGISNLSKRESKKKIALEEVRRRDKEKRLQMETQCKIFEEMQRNLRIADAMMKD